jgi:hypothetical protein
MHLTLITDKHNQYKPVGMRFIKATEQVPEIWVHHGYASKRLNLKVHGFPAIGRFVDEKDRGKKYFEINDNSQNGFTVFDEESFHLIEWLDEGSNDSVEADFDEREFIQMWGTNNQRIIPYLKSKYTITKKQ